MRLAACPFCGNSTGLEARTHNESAEGRHGWETAIWCRNCGSYGPSVWTAKVQPPEVEAAWNERTPPLSEVSDFWDEWRGSLDGRPTMLIKRLVHFASWRLDLHKMIRGDDLECFHTHPAFALRVVLWGGYEEQVDVSGGGALSYCRVWGPANFGIVKPSLCHRVSRLLNGSSSYSLWLRAPARYDVHLRGRGWPNKTPEK